MRKLRSLGDGLPIGSNRPQNPPAAGTLNSPAKRSNVEAVQRCDQALGDYQSACAGLDPVPLRRDGNNHSPVTGSGEGRRNRVGALGAPKRSLKGEQKRSRPARDLAGKSQIGLL